jgi:hypothetical protein
LACHTICDAIAGSRARTAKRFPALPSKTNGGVVLPPPLVFEVCFPFNFQDFDMQHLQMPWEPLQMEHPWSPAVVREMKAMASARPLAGAGSAGHWLPEAERTVLRWRGTVLRLSDHFTATAAAHPHLAAVLLEALGNALEQLLLFGREDDLALLEAWLDEAGREDELL